MVCADSLHAVADVWAHAAVSLVSFCNSAVLFGLTTDLCLHFVYNEMCSVRYYKKHRGKSRTSQSYPLRLRPQTRYTCCIYSTLIAHPF